MADEQAASIFDYTGFKIREMELKVKCRGDWRTRILGIFSPINLFFTLPVCFFSVAGSRNRCEKLDKKDEPLNKKVQCFRYWLF